MVRRVEGHREVGGARGHRPRGRHRVSVGIDDRDLLKRRDVHEDPARRGVQLERLRMCVEGNVRQAGTRRGVVGTERPISVPHVEPLARDIVAKVVGVLAEGDRLRALERRAVQ